MHLNWMENMDTLLEELNSQQREAVQYNEGPSLIIAGAGSGKTRVLTYKIAYLLKQGMAPYNILSLTFTNKAAAEMKERIAELIGWKHARGLWMGTFHSVFSRILRAEAEKIGYTSSFTIFDSADSRNLIKTIIKEYQLDDKVYKPAQVQSIISNAKNALVSPMMYANTKEIQEHDQRSKMPMIKDIYSMYNARLKRANSMDFDDLLFNINRLFRDHPDVLSVYQEQYQFILVDEYQDTNYAQSLVVKQLGDKHHRVCVVGDDAQSIYSFRGANIENILKFKEVYPEAKLFKLEQNYRSTQNIVDAANSVISRNKGQIKKTVFSERSKGDRIEISSAFSDFEEGVIVANKIQELKRLPKAEYSDFAILYRTNAQSRVFEESLRKRNIPYRIYGGLSFYQRKEIKDVIAYFRMVVNPFDEEAFKRIINYPTRGIGATTLTKIIDAAQQYEISLWEIIAGVLDYNIGVNAGTAKKLAGFRQMIEEFITKAETSNAYELATHILKESGIAGEAYKDQTPEGMSKQENLQELLGGIHEFCDTRIEEGNEAISLVDFLSEVSLLTDQDLDKEAQEEKVTMMTVHASKGLEFKNVFVVGLEEDLFPSAMVKNDYKGLEEERRLFYVAITRAKEYCMVSYAKSRFRHGQTNPGNPSRFLRDIDAEYIKVLGSSLNQGEPSGSFMSTYREGRFAEKYKTSRERDAVNDEKIASNIGVSTQPSVGKQFVNVQNAKPKGNAGVNTGGLQEGAIIEHERFGIGRVMALSGEADSRKATVEFENSGTKQLLLKFARFQIVK